MGLGLGGGHEDTFAASAALTHLLLLQVVDSLDVSPHGTRVGLVQYSSRVRTEFPLSMYHTAEEIKAAVMKVNLSFDVPALALALAAVSAEADWLL